MQYILNTCILWRLVQLDVQSNVSHIYLGSYSCHQTPESAASFICKKVFGHHWAAEMVLEMARKCIQNLYM